jgi:hypothetical protein
MGFGWVIRFIGFFDTACDYTLDYTVLSLSHTHMHANTHTSIVTSSLAVAW